MALLGARARAEEPPRSISAKGELQYVGGLSEEANARLFALTTACRTSRRLAIRSRGGDVDGMELGSWVHATSWT